MKIENNETEIIGHWIFKENKVFEDENSKKVNSLINEHLHKISDSESGWEVLYQDPNDNRYWELRYLNSGWHGGGPPSLFNISEEEAKKKYVL